MKKLFSLLTLALLTLSAVAQTSVVLDFTTNDWGFPVGSSAGVSGSYTHTNGDYTIAINATTKYYWNSSDKYLLLGKSGSTLTLPEFNKDVKKIEITGKGGASAAVKQNIYVGENAVSTETTGATGLNTYEIAADYQAAGNVYTLKVTSGHNTQITKIEVFFEETTPVDPTYTEVANLAAANALDSAEVFKFKGNAVVTYQNGKYLYLRDSSGYGLIFNKNASIQPTFTPGTVLAQDWTATKTNYQGYAEYIDYSALSANGTNDQLAAPQVIDALNANLVNAYVKFEHVKSMNSTDKTATLADGTTIALHTTFATIPNFEDGDYYMTGIVSKYNGNLQLLLIDTDYEAPSNNVANLDAANGLEDGAEFTFMGNAVVTYQNGKYLYLRDGSGYGLIYNKSANIQPTFNNGDVLAQGWSATKTTYQGYAEYVDYSALSANGTNLELAAPQVITALDANLINAYVQFNNVVSMDKTAKTATLANGTTIALHTTFAQLEDIENGNFSMTGIVSQFNNNLQLLLIAHDYVAPAGVNKPVITPNGGTFANEVEVTITCDTEDAEIIYTINNGDEITYDGPFTLTESAIVKAYAATDDAESEMAEATFTIVPIEVATYALVTDVTTLADGDKIIIVGQTEVVDEENNTTVTPYAMAYNRGNNFGSVAVTINDNKITTNQANVITLEANGENWNLNAFEGYLYAASKTANQLKAEEVVDEDGNANAAITMADDTTRIIFQGTNTRNHMRFNPNNGNPIFSCYAETSPVKSPVYIYKQVQDQPEVKLGDVNKDGVIRIDDVTALIDALLGGNVDVETEHYSPANADVNGDNVIRIDDVTALIDMLLGGN